MLCRTLLALTAARAASFPMKCSQWKDGEPGACTKCCAWQPVDHFSNIANAKSMADLGAWEQRFTVERKKGWSVDKPVFVVVNNNHALEDSTRMLALPRELAAKEGALLIVLEHRFYGGSRPTQSTDLKDMVYLSSSAAIADVKNFLSRYVRGKETGKPYTKFVAKGQALQATGKILLFGGGYGGALAAWTRQQYPGVVDGAVAISAPMSQTFDFTEYYSIFDQDEAFRTPAVARTCRANLKKSLKTMLTMLKDTSTPSWSKAEQYCYEQHGPGGNKWCGGQKLLEGMFNSTSGILQDPATSKYGYYFLYRIADVIGKAALFQNPSPTQEGAQTWQLDTTCKLMEGADCDTVIMVKSSQTGGQSPNDKYPAPKCIDNLLQAFKYNGNYDKTGLPPATQAESLWLVDSNWMQKLKSPETQPGSDWFNQKAWWWQKCTEMGFFQGTGTDTDIFSSWPTGIDNEVCDSEANCVVFGKKFGEGYCSQIFGADRKFNKKNIGAWVAGSSARYSGKDGFGGSSVYFANGRSDPWNVVSVIVNNPSAQVKTGTYSAGHMAPLTAASNQDPADLTAVRSEIADFVSNTLNPKPPVKPWYGGGGSSWSLVGLISVVLGGVAVLMGAVLLFRRRSARRNGLLGSPRSRQIKQQLRDTAGGAATNNLDEPLLRIPVNNNNAVEQPIILREDETADSEAVAADLSV